MIEVNDSDTTVIPCKVVELSEYKTPEILLEERVKEGIRGVFRNLLQREEEVFLPYDKLTAFTSRQIERIVPHPDWKKVVKCFDEVMKSMEEKRVVLINKPFSGTDEIVRSWLKDNEFKILTGPTHNEILNFHTDRKFKINVEPNENIAIVNLEKWFVRHHDGLFIIESLAEILSTHMGGIIIVCQSWAWNYLTKILNIYFKSFEKRIVQALDYSLLQQWLLELNTKSMRQGFLFRLANNGNLVFENQLSRVDELEEEGKKLQLKVDEKYMKNLVGYSLGLPMICWHIWRNSLRILPDENFQLDEKDEEVLQQQRLYTVWVTPWKDVSLPVIPQNMSSEEQMILHTIALHNGLPVEIMAFILNFDEKQIENYIKKFEKIGLIWRKEEEDLITIAPNAYPRVREYLKRTGYLIDDLEVE